MFKVLYLHSRLIFIINKCLQPERTNISISKLSDAVWNNLNRRENPSYRKMKEFGNKGAEKELVKLRSPFKSPVKVKVKLFEGKHTVESSSRENPHEKQAVPRRNSARSKSPGVNSENEDQVYDPTRSISPGVNRRRENLNSPTRSKSLGVNSENEDRVYDPTRSISPGVNRRRQNLNSPTRSKSPGVNSENEDRVYDPTRSISPGVNRRRENLNSPTRSKSPGVNNLLEGRVYTPNRSTPPAMNIQRSGLPSPVRSISPGARNQRGSEVNNSPTRSVSPAINSRRKDKIRTPTRNIAPQANQREHQVYSPTRSKSPGVSDQENSGVYSPARSKSPGVNWKGSNRVYSPNRSISPGVDNRKGSHVASPNRSKSPGVNNMVDSPSRSISPQLNSEWEDEVSYSVRSKSPGVNNHKNDRVSSPTRSIPLAQRPNSLVGPNAKSHITNRSDSNVKSPLKWLYDGTAWGRESPEISWETGGDDKDGPTVGDTVDISWFLNNMELNADRQNEASEAPHADVGRHQTVGKATEETFRNALNYNLVEWGADATNEENKPKQADEFIQKMCDQVRNQVEYLCGKNFISYEAISYKVKITGPTGVLYYIKVSVWPSYCLHLRVFSDKRELKVTPTLQAILERTQTDNGNIIFF